tara:strand:- start:183 stop:602 length:420 start_codon:yes stop_codon:yes gene_type:complete
MLTVPNKDETSIHAHHYQVHFDILPEITYLDDRNLLNQSIRTLARFPSIVTLDLVRIEEGLDFCQIRFWAFTKYTERIKQFSIWFQAYFRHPRISSELEEMVWNNIEDNKSISVILSDWSRILVQPEQIKQAIGQSEFS